MSSEQIIRPAFVMIAELCTFIETLPAELRGDLAIAIINYGFKGVDPAFDNPVLHYAYGLAKAKIDEGIERQEHRRAQLAENGGKGGAPRGNQNARKKRDGND